MFAPCLGFLSAVSRWTPMYSSVISVWQDLNFQVFQIRVIDIWQLSFTLLVSEAELHR